MKWIAVSASFVCASWLELRAHRDQGAFMLAIGLLIAMVAP